MGTRVLSGKSRIMFQEGNISITGFPVVLNFTLGASGDEGVFIEEGF